MFYDNQSKSTQKEYKQMLALVGGLSRLFSDSRNPFLYYRAHENIFAKYFNMNNNARADDSADAYSTDLHLGVGLKTWVGGSTQKVAEFGKLHPKYESLEGEELINKIASYRNERIETTKRAHNLKDMIYHVVTRVPGAMQIHEIAFDKIDLNNIKLLTNKRSGKNSNYFTDGNHEYNFSTSKNTLYMNFSDMTKLDEFNVEIYEDPFEILSKLLGSSEFKTLSAEDHKERICIPLYVWKKGEKFIYPKSGLNQWNASGRKRHPDEIYIPFNKKDRERYPDFFPGRDVPFTLILPDNTEMSAKVCQDNGKAIMSNPNKQLGKWILRDILNLKEGELLTYEILEEKGFDSIFFTKEKDLTYSAELGDLGSYEEFNNEEN